MITGSVEVQLAMARYQEDHQQRAGLQAPWTAEQQEWQRREQHYREQLERHYFAQQEAEFNAGLSEYYAARRHHQEEQRRLNQVLYGYPSHDFSAYQQHQLHQQQLQQGVASHRHHHSTHGMHIGCDGGMAMDCATATSPRQPLVSVGNQHLSGAHSGHSVGGGMHWEVPVGAVRRKRGHELIHQGGAEQQGNCADSAFKRRAFRHD